ncbi:hypothetical protein BN12_1870002 [Nostocoides japonicum T1-X7]|uniref:Uncharacterized protein n=1 Tax=Nostocoides japonicum T1-X7 TaxID=1194083 RepID=A0A077LUS2_9MICO|nr:hypothetical protein BN12_1870002 [Tetrasphaera japonica T1-X7]
MKAISGADSMKLTGTRTTPIRAAANDRATNSQQLCERRASRSPLASPASATPASTTAASSAYVKRRPPPTRASLSGTREAVRWGRSPSACRRTRRTRSEDGAEAGLEGAVMASPCLGPTAADKGLSPHSTRGNDDIFSARAREVGVCRWVRGGRSGMVPRFHRIRPDRVVSRSGLGPVCAPIGRRPQ